MTQSDRQQWGRRADAGRWMRRVPAFTLATLLLAAATFYAATEYRYRWMWTPIQQAYLPTYLSSTAAAAFGLRPKPYDLLDAQPGLAMNDRRYDNAQVSSYLREAVYDGLSPLALVRQPALAAAFVLVVGLTLAIPRDVARRRARRHGKRLKGPELVDAYTFNSTLASDGLAIVQEDWAPIRIPRALETSHVLILGDTGTGKSSLIRQFLCQIRDRGELAIVYDPAREYLPQFLDETRGDLILNPLDARCPYWTPADEVRQDAEALTLAAALFPPRPNENPFFTEGPQRIFAYLLTLKPSADVLASWLSNGDEIDRLLAGTPYASMVDRHAPQQRAGVLASLNLRADTLTMLPRVPDVVGRWSAQAWARDRRGWLFFTSGPATRARQMPLITLWLDLLILRLMPHRDAPKTWILIDELASLQRLPQLPTALMESRKANTAMVLGFQARSQIEAIYGHAAEAMLSQPATKIVLRTSEANSAKWVSDTIGEVEIERMHESRSNGRRGATTYGLERQREPLVMASEIEGLTDRSGYVKHGNLVTPTRFSYMVLPSRVAGFIEREAQRPIVRPPSAQRSTDGGYHQLID